jgi:hypothetical protein
LRCGASGNAAREVRALLGGARRRKSGNS